MLIGVLFWLLTLLCCSHASVFGGRDGRWASFVWLAAVLLTIPAARLGKSWGETEVWILVVDVLLLASLYTVMLTSRRYWPIYMTGFHLVAVVTHFATMVVPSFTPRLYRAMESFWSIPLLLSLLIGVELDRRAALKSRALAAGAAQGVEHD
jgi:hypothetical protein